MEEISYKRLRAMYRLLNFIKKKRPPCTDPSGHTMIRYRSIGSNECCECGYKEGLIFGRFL